MSEIVNPYEEGDADMQTVLANSRHLLTGILVTVSVLFCITIQGCSSLRENKKDIRDLVSVFKEVNREVVQIHVPQRDGNNALSSGFWIHDTGYIATCWHVVANNPDAVIEAWSAVEPLVDVKKSYVSFANWRVFSARLAAKDERNDLAILKINGPSPLLEAKYDAELYQNPDLSYKKSLLKTELPDPGQRIILAGYPLEQPYLVAQEGIVASVAQNLPGVSPTLKLLISMVANPGNSGGPVFDMDCKVIGILEGVLPSRKGLEPAQAASGIAVAIPAKFLGELISTLHLESEQKKGDKLLLERH